MKPTPIKLGYGTYGMKSVDVFDAVPRLAAMGYEMVEITAAPGWQTHPAAFGASARARLRNQMRDLGFTTAPVMCMVAACVADEERRAMLAEFDGVCEFAREIAPSDEPVIVTSTLGGAQPPWDSHKAAIGASLVEMAEIAARHSVVFAVEPHIGGSLDRPEKAEWLMRATHHPNLRLNYDYSHFQAQGIPLILCHDTCLPYAVHMHIKDGCMRDGAVSFVLPGDGNLDIAGYFRELQLRNCHLPVCVEVSGMVWNAPAYDPWVAAERCFAALNRARSA